MAANPGRWRRRRGISTIYACCAMVGFVAMASLAVDIARVQLVKTELQACADAAARAGVSGIHAGNWAALAATTAQQNSADGAPVTLVTAGADADVAIGNWNRDTLTFTAGGRPTNAVRVIARRTTDRGNAVQLAFTQYLGLGSKNVSAQAVAYRAPFNHAVIGLEYIKFYGNTGASYNSRGPGGPGKSGSIASNGRIHLGGNSRISGDAHPGVGYTIDHPSKVSGATDPLASPLVFPNGTADPYSLFNNDNRNVPGNAMQGNSLVISRGNIVLPGGNYYFENISVGGQASVSFTGPATVYAYGTVSISGGRSSFGNPNGNLKLVMVPGPLGAAPGSISVGGGSSLHATIYAPQSAITLGGNGSITGAVIGKSIDMAGTSNIYYDLATDPDSQIIRLVK